MGRNGRLRAASEAILGKYVTIADKRATVELYFDTFEELIDRNVGGDGVEKMDGILSEKLNEMFSVIPARYEVFVRLHFKDFGAYDREEIEKIIRDNFALKIYSFLLEHRRKTATALSLLGGGVAMLFVSYFFSRLDLPQIVFDVINISGTLFVWEAADIGLIERTADARLGKRYIRKFKGITVAED